MVEKRVNRVSSTDPVTSGSELTCRFSRGSWSMGMSCIVERKNLVVSRKPLTIRPFGSASEDFAKFETILLVGGKLRGSLGNTRQLTHQLE
jgi:hypothetical protein